MSGKKRYIYKNTEVMIHTCSGGVRGKIQDISEHILSMEETQNMIDKYLLSKSKITKERLTEIREKKLDWFLYADEAIKLGIADEII